MSIIFQWKKGDPFLSSFKVFFWMWTIFKSLCWICYNIAFVSYFVCWFLGCTTYEILASWPRMGPTPPTLKKWSPNLWTTREISEIIFCNMSFYLVEIFIEYWSVKSIWVIEILTHLTGRNFKDLKKDCVDLLSTQLSHFQT